MHKDEQCLFVKTNDEANVGVTHDEYMNVGIDMEHTIGNELNK